MKGQSFIRIEITFGYVEADEVVNEGQSEDQELFDELIELSEEVNIGIEDVYQEDVELLNDKINNQEEDEDQEDDQNDGIPQRDKDDKVGIAILQQNGTFGSNYGDSKDIIQRKNFGVKFGCLRSMKNI
ncbi:MAG: hypothetical protein EZS28_041162 [Streblomastix strix]|uniref:Uncharacterized protein n=1 Tax=Streblomastix strix TaxID=222440 RepID=A0A5J4U020_9EUKA|nr:MAG: hypothetical protein EZS28_041162 [Streblomastix strix]